MAGSIADYETLVRAFARHLLAEAAFDAKPTAEREREATLAYVDMVSAACRVDPHALRSPSIKQWIATRVASYRDMTIQANRQVANLSTNGRG